MDDRLRAAPVGVIETTPTGEILAVDERAADAVDRQPADLRGTDITETFPRSAAGTLETAFAGETVESVSFQEYYPRIDRWLAVDVHVAETVVVYVRDRTEFEAAKRTNERLQGRLERLREINELVATVLRQVIGAASREDVGRTLCERLGGADLYGFAWVGERTFPEDRLRSLAAAGTETEMRDAIEAAVEGDEALPEQQAVESGETHHVEAIAEDETIPDDLRRAAFGTGLQSCLAIPLSHQETVYGVVSVYSRQENGFSKPERVGLETLASVAGFAIRAIRQEGLLVADTATEVTVAVKDETLPFVQAADGAGTKLELDGAVPRGDGAVICYLHGSDLDESFADRLDRPESVTDVRRIGDGPEVSFQATVRGDTPISRFVGWGATVHTAEYTGESARFVATLPPDGDVRRLMETVDRSAATTELLAKSDTVPDTTSVETVRDALDERLTDRQHAALRAAYLSEYFDSPRGSTSAEVADTLDIAGSTFLYHLRRAEAELVGAFLEGQSDSED